MPDIVVETKQYIYIIEVKINSTPKVALRQIEEQRYAAPYLADGRKVIKLGVNFSTATRTIDAWEMAE
jgi:Holliday junction resolvase